MPKHAADLAGAGRGVMIAPRPERVRADADLALVEGGQAVDAAKQRGLARPAGPDEGHGLAGLDPQGDVVQAPAAAEPLADVRR